jgi:hypothetical protein
MLNNSRKSRFLKPHLRAKYENSSINPNRQHVPGVCAIDVGRVIDFRVGGHVPDGEMMIGQCPVCAKNGGDKKSSHLYVMPNKAWGCFAAEQSGDGFGHRAEVVRMIPNPSAGDAKPETMADKIRREAAEQFSKERAADAAACYAFWGKIKSELAGPIESLGASSPIPDRRGQFDLYCSFAPKSCERMWVGTLYSLPEPPCGIARQRDKMYFRDTLFNPHCPVDRDRIWNDWIQYGKVDLASGCSWKVDAKGRRKEENRAGKIFSVIEHDGHKDARTPIEHQVALIRWLRDGCGLRLLAVLHTAGKGVHGWFDEGRWNVKVKIPGRPIALSLEDVVRFMGADFTAYRNSATRIPGAVRQGTAKVQQFVWLP